MLLNNAGGMTVKIDRDPTIADALLDRLVHNAHEIRLKGESIRKKRSGVTKEES